MTANDLFGGCPSPDGTWRKPWLYADFPLFPHDSGRWAKKVRGKLHYFGRWGSKAGNRIVPVEDAEASAREAAREFDRQWPVFDPLFPS